MRIAVRGTRLTGGHVLVSAAVMVAIFSAPKAATGQSQTPQCPSCRIQLSRTAVIGGTDAATALEGQLRTVARDHQGRLWLSYFGSLPPVVFDSLGRRIGYVGRMGSGPGEFAANSIVARMPSDSMLVFDLGNARAKIYSAPDRPARSIPIASVPSAASGYLVMRDGYVLAGAARTREQAGYPLHYYDRSGAWKASFGVDVPVMSRGGADVPRLLLAHSNQSSFWAADPLQYEMTLWSTQRSKVLTIKRHAAWFTPSTTLLNPNPDVEPQSRVASIVEQDSQLWALVLVPDRRWRNSFGTPVKIPGPDSITRGRSYTPLADINRYLDTYIEVFDASTGGLLASHLADEALL